jgi:FAD/FMN-containing dehydrogenase
MRDLSSWGRLSSKPHALVKLFDPSDVLSQLSRISCGIPLGMGRSYGDACLNDGGVVWDTTSLDRLISFDRTTGQLACEAGVLLQDIQKLCVAEGWMLPVTPGTQMITVGGAIANDVHGKNHHKMGTFGDHVTYLKIARTDGELIVCSPVLNSEWFTATLGGIGLTGVILEVGIQMRKVSGPWLETETVPFQNIGDFFKITSESENDWEYTVSWIDCLARSGGRGLFMRGNHTDQSSEIFRNKPKLRVPIVPPASIINRMTLKIFNDAYFYLNKYKTARTITHYQPFFYPLDNIQNWNRLYGPKGFYQYQSVVPLSVGPEAIEQMLAAIGESGQGSFLAVLKTFGGRNSAGMLSFPETGVTLALDFPNRGKSTHTLFDQLDNIVRQARGRIYLAKDARMSADLFRSGYPQLESFLKFRDPGISSEMSRRLMGY